jgi:zeaxanthin glucosyltransferase
MRIGVVSLPLSGHLNSMTALARKLRSRGNEVVFISTPDAGPAVRAANLNFVSFCEKEYPVGSIPKWLKGVAKQHGLDVVRYTLRELTPGLLTAGLEHLPEVLAEEGVEALVLDTIYFFLELVPMRLGATPNSLFSWPHETTPEGLARNFEGLKIVGELLAPVLAVAKPYAQKAGIQIDWSVPAPTISRLAVITQAPREFDFPDFPCPAQFHYAGPFHDGQGRAQTPFPWEKLTGKPLVYASMGTLVNGLEHVYRTIIAAVETDPEIQLVLSVGHNIDRGHLGPIPSSTIIVRSAPQLELLRRAALCITHAGLNTALESLAQGVPMVAIPIGYDQPGVAARIAHHGAGELLEIADLTAERLSELIHRVHTNPGYRDRARYFQKVIAETRGLEVAADVIERAFGRNETANSARESAALSHA